METGQWLGARQLRTRKFTDEKAINIFAGGSSVETTRIASVPIQRLSVWPNGTQAPPFSYALDPELSINEADDSEDNEDDFDAAFDDFPSEVEVERRKPADFTEDFADFDDDNVTWQTASQPTLPMNIEWQQSAESRWEIFFDLPRGATCMGLGERQSGLNLRSATHTLFNTDDTLHVESMESMYKSIPFLIVKDLRHHHQCYGLFLDSPARQRWELDYELTGHARIELLSRRGWQLYCMGPAPLPDMLAAYTKLTGRSKLPPLWSLGHQQSRWSYPDQETVIKIAHEFRTRQIPCDTIVIDIDYMDDYRVFTHSSERFPQFAEMVSDLRNNNFNVVTIVDPAVKKDTKFFVFTDGKKHDVFCTKGDGKIFIGEVWPGPSAFPDFCKEEVRRWWAAHHGFHIDLGIAGIWNDMNEPAIFKQQKPLPSDALELPPDTKQLFMQETPEGRVGHFEVRNLYGFQMSRATWEGLRALRPAERPFVLTRSAYAGIQRYAAVWLGDNSSWWDHLKRSIPMLLNMGLSGVPFCGVDIGGFDYDCTPELLIRWYEVGIFYPFFRNHCSMMGASQEPWVFTPEVEEYCRKLIATRYKLIPYIQRLFYEHTRTGAPLMRPLCWHYPQDEFAAEIEDQFMFGEDIMVAPILSRGHTMRNVYFPQGQWYSFDGNTQYEGGRTHLVRLELGEIPAFVKEGTILPFPDPVQSTAELKDSAITFQCYGEACVGLYYEDDGSSMEYEHGSFNEWRLRADDGRFVAQPINLGLSGWPQRDFRMRYKGKLSAVSLGA